MRSRSPIRPIVSLLSALGLVSTWALRVLAQDHGHETSSGHEPASHAVSLDAILHDPLFQAAVIAFLCLLLLYARFAHPAIRRGLKKRRRTIEDQLAEAARIKAEAEAMAKEYESRLARLDDEVKLVRDEMIAAAEAERDRMVAEAEEKAARMRKDAKFQIEQRMKQLRQDLTRESVEAAVSAARQVLLENTTPSDQSRLATQYVEQLASLSDEASTGGAQ